MDSSNPKTQAAHERVNRLVIGPMRSLFNAKIDEYAEAAFFEDLGRFSEDCLTETVRILRRSKKRFPALGEIIETAIAVEERQSEKKGSTFIARASREFPAEAEEVIKSEFGQMALREGWGYSLWLQTRRTGYVAWRDSDATKFRVARQNAIEAAAFADTHRSPRPEGSRGGAFAMDGGTALNTGLFAIWQGMEIKESQMRETYLRP